jgi:hypothetical protein
MGGMFGGSGTTANTFAYLLWGTLRQPEIVKRLKTELKEVLPDDIKIPEAAVSFDKAFGCNLVDNFTAMRETATSSGCNQRNITTLPNHYC